MPADLQDVLGELKEWANANRKDARKDAMGFWIFKIPAMVSSASTGLFAYFGLQTPGVILGAVATLFIIIDGVHPRGMLRNTHLRAFHDLRGLMHEVAVRWRTRNRKADPDEVAAKIIGEIEAERKRIAAYIRDAETALRAEIPVTKQD